MKFSVKLFSLLAVALLLTSCSNSDSGKSSKPNGFVLFFNGVSGTSRIKLEGDTRNYGEVYYEEFGPGISLESNSYSFDVIQPDSSDSSLNIDLALSQSFTVHADDRTLVAVTGSTSDTRVHEVVVAEAPVDDTDYEAALESGAVFLNVAHLSLTHESDTLYVYFLEDGESASALTPDSTLVYGEVSERLELTGDEETMEIYDGLASGPASLVFTSGKRTLKESQNPFYEFQSILVSDSKDVSNDDTLSAYYFHTVGTEIWRENSGLTHVKVVNLAPGLSLTADVTEIDGVTQIENLVTGLAFEDTPVYVSFAVPSIDYLFAISGINVEFGGLYLSGGVAQTAYVYSTKDGDKPLFFEDNKNTPDNRISVSVVNLAYAFEDSGIPYEEEQLEFNVHMVKAGFGPTASTVSAEALPFRSQGLIEETSDGDYRIYVTNADNDIIYATMVLNGLVLGDSVELVVYDSELDGRDIQVMDVTTAVLAIP